MNSRLLMLGKNHQEYGQVSERTLGLVTAYLSVGKDPQSPSLAFKADRRYPNEDALLVRQKGDLYLLAVADAHFGTEASHQLLQRLETSELPEIDLEHESAVWILRELCETIQQPSLPGRSGTTFLLALYDADSGKVLSLSTGDSTLATLKGGVWTIHNRHDSKYLHLDLPSFPEEWQTLSFGLEPGSLLALHTDGIDECHYRCPETSLRSPHIEALWKGLPDEPLEQRARRFGRELVQAALDGVDQNPGGQDNIALLILARPEEA